MQKKVAANNGSSVAQSVCNKKARVALSVDRSIRYHVTVNPCDRPKEYIAPVRGTCDAMSLISISDITSIDALALERRIEELNAQDRISSSRFR